VAYLCVGVANQQRFYILLVLFDVVHFGGKVERVFQSGVRPQKPGSGSRRISPLGRLAKSIAVAGQTLVDRVRPVQVAADIATSKGVGLGSRGCRV